MASSAPFIQNVLDRLEKVKWNGTTGVALCPGHTDRSQSLGLFVMQSGGLGFKCHAGCTYEHILARLNLKKSDLYPPRDSQATASTKSNTEAIYQYTDPSKNRIKEVRKYRDKQTGAKKFIQVRYDEQNRPIWSMAAGEYYLAAFGWTRDASKAPAGAEHQIFPACPNVLYNLPAVLATAKAGGMVLSPEGEKDCNNLGALGLVATTNSQGANSLWLASYTDSLKGVSLVVILADNDATGRPFAEAKASSLHSAAIPVKLLVFPQKDVSDWIEAGGTKEALLRMIEEAPFWSPPPFETYETEEAWKAAGEIAAQKSDDATAMKTRATVELGKWLVSGVKGRGFDYGEKIKTARAVLGHRFSAARRGETVVMALHEAGILSAAQFNRPFDLYLNVAKAPVAKRADYLQRVETYQKGLTASTIAEELREAGDLPPKTPKPVPAWADLESSGVSVRVAHEIKRLSDEQGSSVASTLLERALGLKSNDVRYTDLPGSALKEGDERLPPGEDDLDNLPHILYMQQEICNLRQQLAAAHTRHSIDKEEIDELRKKNHVLTDLAREALPFMPDQARDCMAGKLDAATASVSLELHFAQVEQSEDAPGRAPSIVNERQGEVDPYVLPFIDEEGDAESTFAAIDLEFAQVEQTDQEDLPALLEEREAALQSFNELIEHAPDEEFRLHHDDLGVRSSLLGFSRFHAEQYRQSGLTKHLLNLQAAQAAFKRWRDEFGCLHCPRKATHGPPQRGRIDVLMTCAEHAPPNYVTPLSDRERLQPQ